MKTLLATLIVFLFCSPAFAMEKKGLWWGEDAGLILPYGTIISEGCKRLQEAHQCRFIVTVDIQQRVMIWSRSSQEINFDYEGVWSCVVQHSNPDNSVLQFCSTSMPE